MLTLLVVMFVKRRYIFVSFFLQRTDRPPFFSTFLTILTNGGLGINMKHNYNIMAMGWRHFQ